MPRKTAPFIVAASGCAPPMPPRPPVNDEFSVERSAEMFPPGCGKSFKRALHDSLAADVNPRTGRHLAVHRQSQPLEPIELRVVRFHWPTRLEFAIRTRGASSWVRKLPTGLPD